MTSGTLDSLAAHVAPLAAGAHVSAAAFLGRVPALALADGTVVIGSTRVPAHPDGAILVAAAAGDALLTGGDDGRVMHVGGDGTARELAHMPGRWIDALRARADGCAAWAAGRDVFARDARGDVKRFAAPSTVRGLAFAPKGYRVAVAHYNGATLWFPNAVGPGEPFEWKGSHLACEVSPDGRFLVTSMQENMLHGWRISDGKHMRMSGYPAKSRSLSWSHDGHWLATSGADGCIIWPFKDKDGPMGKPPRECGVRRAKVTTVAFHPGSLVVAVGYDDGFVLLCRLVDSAELLVRKGGEGGALTALAWDAAGKQLVFGTSDGQAGLLTLPGAL